MSISPSRRDSNASVANIQDYLLLKKWHKEEEAAEELLPLLGKLWRKSMTCSFFSRPIQTIPLIDIITLHEKVRDTGICENISIYQTVEVCKVLVELQFAQCTIDIGNLTVRCIKKGLFDNSNDDGDDDDDKNTNNKQAKNSCSNKVRDFLLQHLSKYILKKEYIKNRGRDVVLYGFGRIGRLVARLLIEQTGAGDGLRLRAIVVRLKTDRIDDLNKRMYLLQRDSVHGQFSCSVRIDLEQQAIIANGNLIHIIYSDRPETINYTRYGIHDAIIVDNTGIWRDTKALSQHLKAPGASKVILSAPSRGEGIPNIVHGVNHNIFHEQQHRKIWSAASCTTNAVVPVLFALNNQFGIEYGHIETVHSYTNDQNLLDNYHKRDRRGRSAPLNLVLTETGAAKAVQKAIPELKGKLTGNAIRVPTPNCSLAILILNLKKETTTEQINEYLKKCSLSNKLCAQIAFSHSRDAASTDFIGSRHAGIVDSKSTLVIKNRAHIYIWYDNEFGYSCQLLRCLNSLAGFDSKNIEEDSDSSSASSSSSSSSSSTSSTSTSTSNATTKK